MHTPALYRPIRQEGLREVAQATFPSLAPALALLVIWFAAAGF